MDRFLITHPMLAILGAQFLGAAFMAVAILSLTPRGWARVTAPIRGWARRTFTDPVREDAQFVPPIVHSPRMDAHEDAFDRMANANRRLLDAADAHVYYFDFSQAPAKRVTRIH